MRVDLRYANIFNCILLIVVRIKVSESVTIIMQTSPSYSPVCPEDDVVLTCQGTSDNTFLVFRASNGGTLQTVSNTSVMNTNLNGIVLQWSGMNGTDLTATVTISNIPLNMNGVIISCSTSGVTGTFNMEKVNITGDPPSVTNLTLTLLDNTSAILTWSTNEQPNCVSFYTIELNCENSTFLYNTSNSTPQQIISDLMIGQTYNITVTAIDVVGTSGNRSLPLLYHWNVPSSVNEISAVYIQEINTIVLNWNYSSDNIHPPVLYYAVEHNITGSGEVIFLTDTNVSIMMSMLNEENIFSISIAAVNIIGIGPYLHKNVIIVISPTTSSIGISSSDVTSQIHTGIITTNTLSSSLVKFTTSAVSSTSTSSVQPSNTVCDQSQCSISTAIAVAVPITAVVVVISSLITGIITFLITRRSDSKESNNIQLKRIGGGPVYDTPQWNINQDNELHVETNKAYGQIK